MLYFLSGIALLMQRIIYHSYLYTHLRLYVMHGTPIVTHIPHVFFYRIVKA